MRIGVIADTHDRLEAIDLAVSLFNKEGVQHVFHAGDLVSPFSVLHFQPLKAKLHIVWGNNDGDRLLLARKSMDINATVYGEFMKLTLKERRIAMTHGVDEAIISALVKCGEYDLVIRGHTHRPEIAEEGGTLVVNPGASSGYLAKEKTIAIVDLETMEADIIPLI